MVMKPHGSGKTSKPKKFTYETPDDAISFKEVCNLDKQLPVGYYSCRFLYGERGNWSYCGKPSVESQFWCPEHYALVYQKVKPRTGKPFIFPGKK